MRTKLVFDIVNLSHVLKYLIPKSKKAGKRMELLPLSVYSC